ncbi:Ribosome Assembly protein [Trachipleistophora hominis]|uniref:Ribosome Assembly protein n=1 Tax=Trachipleistophora hominis TaxID=72359 RepID=L7JXM3_TRAHO|nr:Ribosome Assembly protein [Trachipleistophora hominis]
MSDSTSEYEVYYPENDLSVQLEVNSEAYSYLEYITLEYPSQTVITHRSKVLVAQGGKHPTIVELKFKNLRKNADFKHKKAKIRGNINRIRSNSHLIVAVGDDKAFFMDNRLEKEAELFGPFSYGLTLTNEYIFMTTRSGEIIKMDIVDQSKNVLKVHEKGIDGLAFVNDLIFSASNDNTLKITDVRTGQTVYTYQSDNNINSVDATNDNFLFGDDSGTVFLNEMRNFKNIDQIKWHKSPINAVKFKNADVFCSLSDEQVCLWDKSFEEEWEYHKYLYFVHQGQSYYKECAFLDDFIITTSQDGLAIFKPIEEVVDA